MWKLIIFAVPLLPVAAFAQQPQVTAAEASLVNCTISQVRLEDQLKAAKERIVELEKAAAAATAAPSAKVAPK